MRVALYARVSTTDKGQTPENQLIELRRYCAVRGWQVTGEYVDEISGTREQRPALSRLEQDAKRRRFDGIVVWKLDRLGRSLRHLVTLLDTWQATGVMFVSLGEGVDMTTPAGRLQAQILAAIAEFERERIRERVYAGLSRAKAQGKRLGRRPVTVSPAALQSVAHLSVRAAASKLGVSVGTLHSLRSRMVARSTSSEVRNVEQTRGSRST